MPSDPTISYIVNAILNPTLESKTQSMEDFSLKQEVLGEGEVIIDEKITEVSIIDLKGNHFKFPGTFSMTKVGGKIIFSADG